MPLPDLLPCRPLPSLSSRCPGAPLWPGRPSLPPSFLLPPLPGPSSSPSVPPCAPGLVTRARPSLLRPAPPGTCPWETGDKAFPRLGSHPQVHGSASSPSRPFLSPCKSVPAPPDGGERLRPSNSTGPEPACSPRWSSRSPRGPPAPLAPSLLPRLTQFRPAPRPSFFSATKPVRPGSWHPTPAPSPSRALLMAAACI